MTVIIDGSNGLTFPNSTVQASAGSVLQVVNATYSTQGSTTSASYVTTNITASITPKFANSKILVVTSIPIQSALSQNTNLTLYRNAIDVGAVTVGFGYITAGTQGSNQIPAINYLDSPATTSSTSYTIYYKVSGGATAYICVGNSTATITLMEIAA